MVQIDYWVSETALNDDVMDYSSEDEELNVALTEIIYCLIMAHDSSFI